MRPLFLAALLFAILAPFARGGRVLACSCQPDWTPDDGIVAADTVVIGEIISIEAPPPNVDGSYDAKIRVSEYLKGSGPDAIRVHSGSIHGGCGVFGAGSVGAKGVWSLSYYDGVANTGACSGNASLEDSARIRALVSQVEPGAEHEDVPWIPILILALAIPTAALVIPAFFMRGKPHE